MCQNYSEFMSQIQSTDAAAAIKVPAWAVIIQGRYRHCRASPITRGILEPIFPYESHAQEKYLANIRQVPITWNIVRCTRTVLTGLRAISPRLPQLEWCWLGFVLL